MTLFLKLKIAEKLRKIDLKKTETVFWLANLNKETEKGLWLANLRNNKF